MRRVIVIWCLLLAGCAGCITLASSSEPAVALPLSTAVPAATRQATRVSTVILPPTPTPTPVSTQPPTPTFLPTVPTHMVGPTLATLAPVPPTISDPGLTSSTLGLTGVTPRLRELLQRGQAMGNRTDVFSKVGDSLTVATFYLYPFGWNEYNLRAHTDLQPVIDYFSKTVARDANSFANTSLAADNGWTTRTVLDPQKANPLLCQPGESPLLCEYRWSKPAVAIILLGTNDVGLMDAEAYARYLAEIVETTLNLGIIPVLNTLPNRLGYDMQVRDFNRIIIETARRYETPLLDYGTMMYSLPNGGLARDGVHPSWPPGEYPEAADFTPQNLRFGYTLRNLMTLQALDVLRRDILT